MNAIVFGRDKGERSEDYCLLERVYRQKIIFSLLMSNKEKGLVILQKSKEIAFIFIAYSNSRMSRHSCCEMCIMQRMTRIDKNDVLRQYNVKFIMCSNRACGIILLSVTALRRQYQNKPRPSDLAPSLPQRLFHSFHVVPTHRK